MANDDTRSIIANWLPEGLTLEQAIARFGSLTPVYTAAEAYHNICMIKSSFRARHPQANHSDLSPYAEKELEARKELDAQKEIFSRFLTLLTTGVLVVAIRPFSDLGAPLKLLRPNETSQLTIEVHPSQNSLMLYGPDGKEIYALFLRKDMAHMVPPRDALRVELAAFPAVVTQSKDAPHIGAIKSNRAWLNWAVLNIAPDDFEHGDFEHGGKKRYSEKLERILAEDAKTNKKLKRLLATSIAARLNERKLWPNPQTYKKTTK